MSETNQASNLSSWEEAEKPLNETTMAEMDSLARMVAHARQQYEDAKAAATEFHDYYEELSQKFIGVLKATGRTSHTTPGVGTMRFAVKEAYRVPKTVEQKRELFRYIQKKYGVDALTDMLSIHAAKINSWANEELEADPGVQIPGLEAPTMTETFYFTKK